MPELNLLPLMNVFVVLIPMLLVSAVFIEVTVIRMDGTGGDVALAEPAEPLDLTVRFDPAEYVVIVRGQVVNTVARPGDAASAPDQLALDTLGGVLGQVVAAYPPDPSIKLIAAETTRYEEIVAVMDVARAHGLTQAGLVGATGGAY